MQKRKGKESNTRVNMIGMSRAGGDEALGLQYGRQAVCHNPRGPNLS